jgi:hypothetical protein
MEPGQDFLLSNRPWMDIPWLVDSDDDNTRAGMKEQKQRFLNATELPILQYDYAMRCLTYAGDFCAKRKLSAPVAVAWHKMKESGMIPRENCVSTFMYTGLDDTMGDTCLEVATFHDLLFPPEKTGYLRQVLDCQGDTAEAERILTTIPTR